jgi:hypothetical protein
MAGQRDPHTRVHDEKAASVLGDRLQLMFDWCKGMVDESTGRFLYLYDPENDVAVADGVLTHVRKDPKRHTRARVGKATRPQSSGDAKATRGNKVLHPSRRCRGLAARHARRTQRFSPQNKIARCNFSIYFY